MVQKVPLARPTVASLAAPSSGAFAWARARRPGGGHCAIRGRGATGVQGSPDVSLASGQFLCSTTAVFDQLQSYSYQRLPCTLQLSAMRAIVDCNTTMLECRNALYDTA